MEKNKNIQKLISKEPSKWKENAQYLRENPWLEYSSQIARRIVAYLHEHPELNQTKLAELLKVERQRVNTILKGHENLTLKAIYNLSTVLNTPLITFPEYKYMQPNKIIFAETYYPTTVTTTAPNNPTTTTKVPTTTQLETKKDKKTYVTPEKPTDKQTEEIYQEIVMLDAA